MWAVVYLCASKIENTYSCNQIYIKEQKGITRSRILFWFICLILTLVPALRYGVGTDYSTYRGLFQYYMRLPFHYTISQKEGGFWAISSIIGYLTSNVNWVFAVHAAIIVLLIVGTLYKYSSYFAFSLFLYITMMDYFSSFNGMRQWTAAAIVFCGIRLLYDKKFIWYFLLVLLAYNFHNTAVLMIPLSFFLTRKAGSKPIKMMSVSMFVFIFVFPSISNYLFDLMEGSDYQHYALFDTSDDGVNILRVLVAAVPVVFSARYYHGLYETEEEQRWIDILINGSLLNFLFMTLALRSTVMARFCMYVSPFNALLIPYFLRVFKEESKMLAQGLMMLLFLIYMIMLLPTDSNLLPYRTIFSIGS
jgi:transmembrane protein EpsG